MVERRVHHSEVAGSNPAAEKRGQRPRSRTEAEASGHGSILEPIGLKSSAGAIPARWLRTSVKGAGVRILGDCVAGNSLPLTLARNDPGGPPDKASAESAAGA